MNDEPPDPGLGTLLRQLLARLDGDVQDRYDAMGVPFRPRFHPIFRRLLDGGPATVKDLARAMRATQPAATQTIKELERLRLVSKGAGSDQRERLVELSTAGRELAEALDPIWKAVERAASRLDEELPTGLRPAIKAALAALERRSFTERIDDALSDQEKSR